MTKTQAISQMILDKMSSIAAGRGASLPDRATIEAAIDHVLGDGTFAQLVSDLYDELRAAQ